MSQSSFESDANFSIRRSWSSGPLCHCRRTSTIVKVWTNENPGRRFFRCAFHGFFSWADDEKPHGWQKVSLLEARDEIPNQKKEINALRESCRALNEQIVSGTHTEMLKQLEEVKSKLESDVMASKEKEKMLESEVMASKEREQMLCQFIVLCWAGFIVVIAMILVMGKM